MENRTGAVPIRTVTAMSTIAKPIAAAFHLPPPRLRFLRLFSADQRRRQATIDLIQASPHLLRDIGATEDRFAERRGK